MSLPTFTNCSPIISTVAFFDSIAPGLLGVQMNHPVYSVVSINRRWFADCGDTRHGPYTSAETASLVALNEGRARRNQRAP